MWYIEQRRSSVWTGQRCRKTDSCYEASETALVFCDLTTQRKSWNEQNALPGKPGTGLQDKLESFNHPRSSEQGKDKVLYSRIISLKCSCLIWIYYYGQWSVWAAPAGWESNITADLPRTFHTNITESARKQFFSLLIHTQHPKAESPFFTNHLVLRITLHDNCVIIIKIQFSEFGFPSSLWFLIPPGSIMGISRP